MIAVTALSIYYHLPAEPAGAILLDYNFDRLASMRTTRRMRMRIYVYFSNIKEETQLMQAGLQVPYCCAVNQQHM
jgi:hypothetical protein